MAAAPVCALPKFQESQDVWSKLTGESTNPTLYNPLLRIIEDLGPWAKKMSDQELKAKTARYQEYVQAAEDLEAMERRLQDVLCEAFAVVREAADRVIGLRHYNVQLLGGIILHTGKIAEMKTGEGKTLAATLPAYVNALSGRGVYIVTVNDYLARRDAQTMGQIFRFLGLSVGLVQNNSEFEERQAAYDADITYITNSELGFDYLRDNVSMSPLDVVRRRPLQYCIIDEVDSILIDEARTPLLISGPGGFAAKNYELAVEIAEQLEIYEHYEIKEKFRQVIVNSDGWDVAQQLLKQQGYNLHDTEAQWATCIINGLKAKELFHKGVDYVVKNGEVMIVDEFTGRAFPGRRWTDGLHQVIEAKEKVKVQPESTTFASISYQNLFKQFPKLSGMTGTASTERTEFIEVYDLPVVVVPPHRPSRRVDMEDSLYMSKRGKLQAILHEAAEMHAIGRPVLIGTGSVVNSELISDLFTANNLEHQVLNARPELVEREAEIIAQAGRKGRITIATNMAGRGTDILLGGNADYLARRIIRTKFTNAVLPTGAPSIAPDAAADLSLFPCELSDHALRLLDAACKLGRDMYAGDGGRGLPAAQVEELVAVAAERIATDDHLVLELRRAYRAIVEEYSTYTCAERDEVVAAGGLHILGTERHESRRIDNQLRGRAGRQGDPGNTHFILSLEDDLLRVFAGPWALKMCEQVCEQVDFLEEQPLPLPFVSGALDKEQAKVEDFYRDVRQRVMRMDGVSTSLRLDLYNHRSRILLAEEHEVSAEVRRYLLEMVDELLGLHKPQPPAWRQVLESLPQTVAALEGVVCCDLVSVPLKTAFEQPNMQALRDFMYSKVLEAYGRKEAQMERASPGSIRELERTVILQRLDVLVQKQERDLKFLKDSLGMRQYGGRNPFDIFAIEGRALYDEMQRSIRRDVVYTMFRLTP